MTALQRHPVKTNVDVSQPSPMLLKKVCEAHRNHAEADRPTHRYAPNYREKRRLGKEYMKKDNTGHHMPINIQI